MKNKIASKNFILKITLQRNLQSVAIERNEVYVSRAGMAKGNTHLQKVNKCFTGVGFFVVLCCPGRKNLFRCIPDMELT